MLLLSPAPRPLKSYVHTIVGQSHPWKIFEQLCRESMFRMENVVSYGMYRWCLLRCSYCNSLSACADGGGVHISVKAGRYVSAGRIRQASAVDWCCHYFSLCTEMLRNCSGVLLKETGPPRIRCNLFTPTPCLLTEFRGSGTVRVMRNDYIVTLMLRFVKMSLVNFKTFLFGKIILRVRVAVLKENLGTGVPCQGGLMKKVY
jgi:hypothetical protein